MNNQHRLVANRAIKFFGHICKYLCYGFHFIFPNKRFRIKPHAKPLWSSTKPGAIPRTVWLTNYTDQVSLPVYLNYLFNRMLAPSYAFNFMDDDACITYVNNHFDHRILAVYNQLNDGAAKADMWRLLVLNHQGGIYLDIDAHLIWPLARIVKNYTALYIAVKQDHDTKYKQHYTNYFLASTANNPHFSQAIELIIHNVTTKSISLGVYALTGPDVLNQAIDGAPVCSIRSRYVCVQGSFTNEHFQYIDKKMGKWTHTKPEDILKNPQ